ncbi:TraM recognition domain-containing protein [Candidatus Nomurabacteria bacterium]|nr:TraM recognition domain-containing protein [Candidatus Nomurabacteria bacterium]
MKLNQGIQSPDQQFSTPQEELSYLRQRIDAAEKRLQKENSEIVDDTQEQNKIIRQELDIYSDQNPEHVLKKGLAIPERARDEIVLELRPEAHDDKMAELISIAEQKGIANVLDIVAKLDDPHISDDFHRFLVEYVREDYPLNGLKESMPIFNDIKRALFEVVIPEKFDKTGEDKIQLGELVFRMQNFLSGMISVTDEKSTEYLTLEIANPVGSKEFVFYISVPNRRADLFEKQLLSVFSDAKVTLSKDDFNIFVENGYAAGSYASLKKMPAEPLKTIEEFESDPLDVLLNVFTKIDEKKGGAAVQMVFRPVGDFYNKHFSKGLKKMEKDGGIPEEFFIRNTVSRRIIKNINNLIKSTSKEVLKKEGEEGMLKEKDIDSGLMERIRKKNKSPIISTNVRIVTSAETLAKAEDILYEIQSAFNQFEDANGNRFVFEKIKKGKHRDFFTGFSYRRFDNSFDIPLNIEEIATIFHLPSRSEAINRQVRKNKAASAAAPITLGQDGILLGINEHSNVKTEIYMSPEDRLRHFYVIGQTGTGKTNFLKDLIIQDIQNGEGVCMIDPHGNDIEDILANIPKERYDDLIYFDPSYTARPMGLNMLEYDPEFPEQKTFVVNELFSIFQKLYGAVPESMGPMFEQYFRNATLLVIEDPDSGSTLLDVSRVMADKEYRQLKVSRCKNPIVVQFWKEIAEKAGGEASLANIVPYITSKFDIFLANDIMRPVIAQEKSSFNFRKIMDERKILLVNLSKGRLGDINSHLIGLILVGKILMAALSRVDSGGQKLPTFYLYIDEFQNITTNSIATILSEARKYGLSLHLAHQFIAQLEDDIKNAVFGNVGSMAVFRVGSDDADYLENQFLPTFSANDIMNVDNYHNYMKMLSGGVPQKPFSMRTLPAPEGDKKIIENLKQLSYFKFGKQREVVEEEILMKFKKESKPVSKFSPQI